MSTDTPDIDEDSAEDCTCRNQHPHLNEFVGKSLDVHWEAMGEADFWMSFTDSVSGRSWHITCGAVNQRARGYASIEEIPA